MGKSARATVTDARIAIDQLSISTSIVKSFHLVLVIKVGGYVQKRMGQCVSVFLQ